MRLHEHVGNLPQEDQDALDNLLEVSVGYTLKTRAAYQGSLTSVAMFGGDAKAARLRQCITSRTAFVLLGGLLRHEMHSDLDSMRMHQTALALSVRLALDTETIVWSEAMVGTENKTDSALTLLSGRYMERAVQSLDIVLTAGEPSLVQSYATVVTAMAMAMATMAPQHAHLAANMAIGKALDQRDYRLAKFLETVQMSLVPADHQAKVDDELDAFLADLSRPPEAP